jgi:predicted kinase
VLIVFGGLPGTGKTSIATRVAQRLRAAYVRLDPIELAFWIAIGRPEGDIGDAGYRIAYAVADSNLKLGAVVVTDTVNPVEATRAAWREVARRAGAPCLEVEIVCTDAAEHRRRVETRVLDIADFTPPTWQEVVDRHYEPWDGVDLRLDTATLSADAAAARVCEAVEALRG